MPFSDNKMRTTTLESQSNCKNNYECKANRTKTKPRSSKLKICATIFSSKKVCVFFKTINIFFIIQKLKKKHQK